MRQYEDYTVESEYGRTNRADLYVARRDSDGAEVLIKEYRIPAGTAEAFHEKYIERFNHECRWHTSISHLNVVDTLDVIWPTPEHPTPVLVMERLGDSLQNVYMSDRTISIEEAVAWLAHTLAGVRALHERQIIHRDLKPSNILLNELGRPKIIDLSIAIEIGNPITLLPDDISTQYAAPEMYLEGDATTFATDIYSIGFMFYQLLCGMQVFEEEFQHVISDNDRQTLLKWMHWHNDMDAEATPLAQIQRAVPEPLSALIAKMTAKRLESRYLSADDVLKDLVPVAKGIGGPIVDIVQKIAANVAPDATLSGVSAGLVGATLIREGRKKPAAGNRRKKVMMTAAIASAAVFTLLAVVGFFILSAQRVQNTALRIYDRAMVAYEDSEYDDARRFAAEGRAYIIENDAEDKFTRVLQLLDLVALDSDAMESLSGDLDSAETMIGELRFEEAEEILQSVLAVTFEQGERNDRLARLTSSKIDEFKERANRLLAALNDRRGASDRELSRYSSAVQDGKFRQALCIASELSELPPDTMSEVEELKTIVAKLDRARLLYDQKRFVEAQSAYLDVQAASAGRSLEAEYYLSKIHLWPMASIIPDPAQYGDMRAFQSFEAQLFEAMFRISTYLGRKYDLEITAGIDELAADARRLANDALAGLNRQAASPDVFEVSDAVLEELGMMYPPEESRDYFANLLADLVQILFVMESEAGNIAASDELLAAAGDGILPQDVAYMNARLLEHEMTSESYSQGVKLYEDILTAYPDWADCHFRRGLLLCRYGNDIESGLSSIERAIELAPRNERYKWWGARLADEHAAQLIKSGEFEGAKAFCERARSFWEAFPASYFTQAMIGWEQKNIPYTIEQLDKFDRSVESRRYQYTTEDEYAGFAAEIRRGIPN